MSLFSFFKKNNPNSIYYENLEKPKVDTSGFFSISQEGTSLRVKNKNINFLFANLSSSDFDRLYNDIFIKFNPNFSPIKVDEYEIFLTKNEQEELTQNIICNCIKSYLANNKKVKKSDFHHPNTILRVQLIIDKKFPRYSTQNLSLGSHIMRMKLKSYHVIIKNLERLANLF